MKRLLAPIILIIVILASCQSKKNVVMKEHHTTDTVYIEKQSENTVQSAFDWSNLGLSFDSLVVVTDPPSPIVEVDNSMRPPPTSGKTILKVFGGTLNHNKASGETLHAEREKTVETAARSEDVINNKASTETKTSHVLTQLPGIICFAVLMLILIFFRKRVVAVVKKWTYRFLD